VENMTSCIDLCCYDKMCDAAFMLGHHCVVVYCKSKISCETVAAKRSNLHPMISFIIRGTSGQSEGTTMKSQQIKSRESSTKLATEVKIPFSSRSASSLLPIKTPISTEGEHRTIQTVSKAYNDVASLTLLSLLTPTPSLATVHTTVISRKEVSVQGGISILDPGSKQNERDINNNIVNMTNNVIKEGAVNIKKAPYQLNGSADPKYWLHNTDRSKANVSASQSGEILRSFPGGMPSEGSTGNLPLCSYSPISYNVTLRHSLESGYYTDQGSVSSEDCSHLCCQSPSCNVAFMLNGNCYSVDCQNPKLCELVGADASSARTSIVFVVKVPTAQSKADHEGIVRDANKEHSATTRSMIGASQSNSSMQGSLLFKLHSPYNGTVPSQKRESVVKDNESSMRSPTSKHAVEGESKTTPRVEDIGDEVLPPTVKGIAQTYTPTTANYGQLENETGQNAPELMTENSGVNEGMYDNSQGFQRLEDVEMQVLKSNGSSGGTKRVEVDDMMKYTSPNKQASEFIGNLKENDETVKNFEAEFDAIADAADSADAVAKSAEKVPQGRGENDKDGISMEVLKLPTMSYDKSGFENVVANVENGKLKYYDSKPTKTVEVLQRTTEGVSNSKNYDAESEKKTRKSYLNHAIPEALDDQIRFNSDDSLMKEMKEITENQENSQAPNQGSDMFKPEMDLGSSHQKEESSWMVKSGKGESEESQKILLDDLKLPQEVVPTKEESYKEPERSKSEISSKEEEEPTKDDDTTKEVEAKKEDEIMKKDDVKM